VQPPRWKTNTFISGSSRGNAKSAAIGSLISMIYPLMPAYLTAATASSTLAFFQLAGTVMTQFSI